jgi:PAS domain S-box-containing protein
MAVKKTEAKSPGYAESIINTVREPLIVLDHDLRVVTASRSFYDFFKVKPEETVGQLIYDLGNRQWNIPKLRELLETILPQKTTFDNYEVEHDFTTIGRRIMLLNARQIQRALGKEHIILLAIEDITERKQLENLLTDSEDRYRHLFETSSDGIVFLEQREGKITNANTASEKMLGYTKKELIGNKLENIGVLLDMGDFQTTKQLLNRSGFLNYTDVLVKTKSGRQMDTDIYLVDRATLLQCSIRDVSERKRTEDALRRSEEKYRNILEDIQEGYFEVDFAGNFTFFNDSLRRFLGYSKEELTGMNNRQYTDKEHSKELFQTFNKVYDTGEPIDGFDWQIIRKDGTKRYVEASISLRKDSSGKPIGFRGIARDVTDRKRMEEELKESEKQYRTFFNTSRDCVFITSINGRLIDMNDAAVELFGYASRDELMQISIPDLYVKKEERTKHTNAIVKKGYSKDYPVDMRRKDGGVINTLITSSLQYDANGRVIGFMGTIKDITERKKSEEALKNSEAKYRNIFENSVEGIYQATIEGRFITANTALARMAGYDSPEELIESIKDMGTQLYVHPDDRKRFIEIREAKGFVDGFEVEFYKKDGSTFWVVINARAVKDEQGKIIYHEGLIEDITIRKHAEEQLHQTLDRLKKAVGATIQVLMSAVESRDPYTAGHQKRVADLARTIATEMGLAPDKIEGIRMAGSIHDIGKLSIPAEILSKPTKLTDIEFSLIKEHSQSGYEMLKNVESPWPLAQIVYQHHERINGSGYPRNLKGDEILIDARIMAVADVVEAMASHRPYRPTLGIEAALEEIEKNKGILYDDVVAEACLRLFREKGYKLPA